MNRQEARKTAFQILFQMDINDIEPDEAMESFLETREIDSYIQKVITGVNMYKAILDEAIKHHLENWRFERIAMVEKTLLRLAVYEIKYADDIPVNVSINEAVELGHKFGDENSGPFINGVLSKVSL